MKSDNRIVEKLKGTVTRIIYRNDTNGFTVLSLQTDNGDTVKATGTTSNISVGDPVELEGIWSVHSKFGKQFDFSSYRFILPSSGAEIKEYLASGSVKGIGPELASRIVALFGENTFNILDSEPGRLLEVNGIGKKKSRIILGSWRKKRESRDIMLFLQTHGLTLGTATKVFKKYGQDTVKIVKENPYAIIRDIQGIGFTIADRLASGLGIQGNDQRRIKAGLIHIMHLASENGHVFLPFDLLSENTAKILQIPTQDSESSIFDLIEMGELYREDDRIYLPTFYSMEKFVADKLLMLLGSEATLKFDAKYFDIAVNESSGITLTSEQIDSLWGLLEEPVSILTGGPGTGKTTITKWLVKILLLHSATIALAAPTGRASKRLAESCGFPAKTIHRLLHFDPETRNFMFNQDEPLEVDVILIDEASMVDLHLFYSLLLALKKGTRLILIGDSDQLPPVGAGNIFMDLILSDIIPVSKLSRVFRQKQTSSIISNAHQIKNGRFPDISNESSDFFFIENDNPKEASEIIVDLVCKRLPSRFEFDSKRDIQIITPMYKGEVGADNLNIILQKALNPGEEGWIDSGRFRFSRKDKVMQLKNDYKKNIFNGDIGFILDIDRKTSTMIVNFDTGSVKYTKDELDSLTLAYAITVHKSQGSEFPVVVMPLTTQHYIMLQRNLVYTALTRAKKLMIFVGSKKALGIAVRNNKTTLRFTSLTERLQTRIHHGYF